MIIKRNGTAPIQNDRLTVKAWKLYFISLSQKSHKKEPLEEPWKLPYYAARGSNPASLRLHIYSPLMCFIISFSDSSGVLQCWQVAHIRLQLWSNKRYEHGQGKAGHLRVKKKGRCVGKRTWFRKSIWLATYVVHRTRSAGKLKNCVVLQVKDAAVSLSIVIFGSKVQLFYTQIT